MQRRGTIWMGMLVAVALAHTGCRDGDPGNGTCDSTADCPKGQACSAGRCAAICISDDQCRPSEACTQGICQTVPDPDCVADGDCTTPQLCQIAQNARCRGGRCRYPGVALNTPCDDGNTCTVSDGICDGRGSCDAAQRLCPPAPEPTCIEGDTIYRAWVLGDGCDPGSGDCTYVAVDDPCPGCTANCLHVCDGFQCPDSSGGCAGVVCVPDNGSPTCESHPVADGAPCDLGGATGICSSGACAECIDDGDCAPSGDTCLAGVCACGSASACDGNILCLDGTCGCQNGEKDCGTRCVPADGCCSTVECTGGASCVADQCVCPDGQKRCGDTCIESTLCCEAADCTGGRVCNAGACECPDGSALCRGVCTPQTADCCEDVDCGPSGTCTSGSCSCGTGSRLCDGRCLATSACCDNGDCNGDLSCVSGICRCATGTRCGDRCLTPGQCCTAEDCPHNQSCQGDDTCGCGSDRECADGTCVAQSECCESSECQGTIPGSVCTDGACLCPSGTELCNGVCVEVCGPTTSSCSLDCDGTQHVCINLRACTTLDAPCTVPSANDWAWLPLAVVGQGTCTTSQGSCTLFDYPAGCFEIGNPPTNEGQCWAIDDNYHYDTEKVCRADDGSGVAVVSSTQSCPAQHTEVTDCTDSLVCVSDPDCSSAGQQKCEGPAVWSCIDVDGEGCLKWQTQQICNGGTPYCLESGSSASCVECQPTTTQPCGSLCGEETCSAGGSWGGCVDPACGPSSGVCTMECDATTYYCVGIGATSGSLDWQWRTESQLGQGSCDGAWGACWVFDYPGTTCLAGPGGNFGTCWAYDRTWHFADEFVCDDAGKTVTTTTCPGGSQPVDDCSTTDCTDQCTTLGADSCISGNAHECQQVGCRKQWVPTDVCNGSTPECTGGACVECLAGQRRCTASLAQVCSSSAWLDACQDGSDFCFSYNGGSFQWQTIPTCNDASACNTFDHAADCWIGGNPATNAGKCWAIDDTYHYDTEYACSNGSDFEIVTQVQGCTNGYTQISCSQTAP